MRSISLQNPTVLSELNAFSDWFFNEYDYKALDSMKFHGMHDQDKETTTLKFLNELMAKGEDHDGFPPSLKGHELAEFSGKQKFDPELIERIDRIITKLEVELGVRRNALTAYYPPGGYIGWHTNWNAPGYNVLFSFSLTGEGKFMMRNPETGEIIDYPDKAGEWTAKVGYYGTPEEPKEKHCWHAAVTDSPRLTFAYMIPDKEMWEMMVEDLESPE